MEEFMETKRTHQKKLLLIGWTILLLVLGFAVLIGFAKTPETPIKTSAVLQAAPGSFSQLAKGAKKSVVNISTVKVIKGEGFRSPFGQGDRFHDFFDRFFRDQIPRDFRQRSLGSGFIMDKEGFILTNNHVVEKTDEIKVKLANGKEYNAKIIGRDPMTDLALIRIETDDPLTPLSLGDSDKLEVGDWVVAIGNPFGLGHTVTAGIVSAKYRRIGAGSYDNFIQTDASINPGNSGGPLLNTQGEVVGINSAIYSGGGGNIGIGFAIPVNMAKVLLPQLKKGKVVRGWLGVMIQKITPELKEKLNLKDEEGALVADVSSAGPAEKAGIRRGDVIISFDGKKIREMNELPFIVAATPVGKTVTVEGMRKGEKKSFEVKIGKLEGEREVQAGIEEERNLGMTLNELTPELARQFGLSEERGLVVGQVEPNSPAGEAGITRGDIILEIDQAPVADMDEYRKRIRRYRKGDTMLLLVKRRGVTLYLTLKILG
jgi:serine protease Do